MLVFMSGEFSKTLANLSRLFAANCESPLPVPEKPSAVPPRSVIRRG